MKLKYEFENVEIDGEIMAVPVGENSEDLHAMLRLNETAAFILEELKEDTTEESIIEKIKSEYDCSGMDVEEYVHSYIEKLKENGIIE